MVFIIVLLIANASYSQLCVKECVFLGYSWYEFMKVPYAVFDPVGCALPLDDWPGAGNRHWLPDLNAWQQHLS